MTQTAFIMDLIKHRLCTESHPPINRGKLTDDMVQKLMFFAKKHDIIPIICSQLWIEDSEISKESKTRLQEAICISVCHYEIMNYELNWIDDILEKAKIPHIALKGAAIRKYYPEPWLRTSGDIDILVREDMLDQAISVLGEKGCISEQAQKYHDVPLKTPRNNLLELHFSILENIPSLDCVLEHIWEYCELVPGRKYTYRQRKEFLLFHMLAHMSYHLIHGGCGIRSFTDVWLFHKNESFDYDVFRDLLNRAQLIDFYDQVMKLIQVWFEGENHSDTTQLLEAFILDGGTFGTREKEIIIEQAQAGNRLKYLFYRIFMPYRSLKLQYPILNQHPILLPCCQILRWFRILTHNRNVALKEVKTSHSQSGKQIQITKEALKQIGLNF